MAYHTVIAGKGQVAVRTPVMALMAMDRGDMALHVDGLDKGGTTGRVRASVCLALGHVGQPGKCCLIDPLYRSDGGGGGRGDIKPRLVYDAYVRIEEDAQQTGGSFASVQAWRMGGDEKGIDASSKRKRPKWGPARRCACWWWMVVVRKSRAQRVRKWESGWEIKNSQNWRCEERNCFFYTPALYHQPCPGMPTQWKK